MKLYLIRHGETIENVGTLLMGRTEGELSELGKNQATKTGLALKEYDIDYIYSSPLARCIDTALLINKSINIKIEENDLLIERDFGIYTNSQSKEINFKKLDENSEENKKAGVESLEQIRMRVLKFLSQIYLKHKDQNIVIITHNNPIRLFLGEFLNKNYQEILKEYKVHNCSINIIEILDNKNYKIIKLDDISHLN